MKKIITFLFVCLSVHAISQTSIHFVNGGYGYTDLASSPNSFQKLMPNSSILSDAIQDNNYFDSDYRTPNMSFGYQGQLALEFNSKKGGKLGFPNASYRVGIGFNSTNSLSYNISKSATGRYDTLTSSNTGDQTLVDTTYNEFYGFNYDTRGIFITGEYLLSTNIEKRFVIKVGVGFQTGFTTNASSTAYATANNANYQYETYNYTASQEIVTNQTASHVNVFLPIELDYTICKKPSSFFNHLHFTFSLKPTLNYTNIPELGAATNNYTLFSGGIRYAI
jgi:hypothetical protein